MVQDLEAQVLRGDVSHDSALSGRRIALLRGTLIQELNSIRAITGDAWARFAISQPAELDAFALNLCKFPLSFVMEAAK